MRSLLLLCAGRCRCSLQGQMQPAVAPLHSPAQKARHTHVPPTPATASLKVLAGALQAGAGAAHRPQQALHRAAFPVGCQVGQHPQLGRARHLGGTVLVGGGG